MGSFFTNVLVRSKHGLDSVEAAVDRVLEVDGWQRISVDASCPARRVVLRPADGWVAVYDEGTETQNLDVLECLAANLSSCLGTSAISTLVHDSDYPLVQLFESGDTIGFGDSLFSAGKLMLAGARRVDGSAAAAPRSAPLYSLPQCSVYAVPRPSLQACSKSWAAKCPA